MARLAYRGFRAEDGSPLKEGAAALRQASHHVLGKPILLSYTPVGRTNPYQALLYRGAESAGIAVSPIIESWDFTKIVALRSSSQAMVLHIHWTSFVLNDVQDRSTAKKKVDEFKKAIDLFIDRGGYIVWTLHNIIPHDSRYVDLEVDVQQYLSKRAHVLHAMSDASVDIMSELISLDRSKVILVPHPSYKGTYEDYVSHSEARLTLGIEPDERVYVMLGALKTYKGLNRLLEAFETFCDQDGSIKRKLLVGGMPDEDADVKKFVHACERSDRVLIEPKKIPSSYVQYYMRAADIGLAPYKRMLNSGAILLYQTFDLPVITSAVPALWEHMDNTIAEKVDDDSVEALVSSFARSDRFLESDMRWAVRSYVNQFDPHVLSEEFFRDMLSIIERHA